MGRTPTPTPTPADPPPAVLALAAQADVEITRAERVYVDVPDTRTMLPDGRLCAIRRERRGDGSLGPFVAHILRRDPAGRETGAVPATLLDFEAIAIAFERRGVKLFRSAAEYDSAHPAVA